jgi:dynein heavy chain
MLFAHLRYKNLCRWTVWSKLKETIDAFKQTLPLTVDLRNPAMRKRHWDTLVEHVGTFFDPTSKDFTLAKVISCLLNFGTPHLYLWI